MLGFELATPCPSLSATRRGDQVLTGRRPLTAQLFICKPGRGRTTRGPGATEGPKPLKDRPAHLPPPSSRRSWPGVGDSPLHKLELSEQAEPLAAVPARAADTKSRSHSPPATHGTPPPPVPVPAALPCGVRGACAWTVTPNTRYVGSVVPPEWPADAKRRPSVGAMSPTPNACSYGLFTDRPELTSDYVTARRTGPGVVRAVT